MAACEYARLPTWHCPACPVNSSIGTPLYAQLVVCTTQNILYRFLRVKEYCYTDITPLCWPAQIELHYNIQQSVFVLITFYPTAVHLFVCTAK